MQRVLRAVRALVATVVVVAVVMVVVVVVVVGTGTHAYGATRFEKVGTADGTVRVSSHRLSVVNHGVPRRQLVATGCVVHYRPVVREVEDFRHKTLTLFHPDRRRALIPVYLDHRPDVPTGPIHDAMPRIVQMTLYMSRFVFADRPLAPELPTLQELQAHADRMKLVDHVEHSREKTTYHFKQD
jgi:hypothetical protein